MNRAMKDDELWRNLLKLSVKANFLTVKRPKFLSNIKIIWFVGHFILQWIGLKSWQKTILWWKIPNDHFLVFTWPQAKAYSNGFWFGKNVTFVEISRDSKCVCSRKNSWRSHVDMTKKRQQKRRRTEIEDALTFTGFHYYLPQKNSLRLGDFARKISHLNIFVRFWLSEFEIPE